MMKQNKRLVAFTVAVITILIVSSILPASAQLSQWRSLNPTRNGTIDPSGLGPILYSVHMVSSSVGWAVGGTCHIYDGTDCSDTGFVLYWDGMKWRQILTPPNTRTLASVFAVSANDVWAVGMSATIIHWDGTSWVKVTAPAGTTDLFSVFILPGGTDGWAVGDGDPDSIRWSGTWPTGAWSAGPTPPLSSANKLRSVSFSSPTFGWIVSSGGEIFRWDGAGWNPTTSPVPSIDMLSVFAVSGNDAWAVGAGNTIIRWNGASWTGPMVAPTSSVDYRSIKMVSESDGWIAGILNPTSKEGTLLRWNGVAWNIVRSWVTVDLNSLFMLPGGSTGSAVGNAETIIHWNGSIWLARTSPTGTNLNAVSMVAPNSGWAVGDTGRILSYDGTSWSHYETLPSGVNLYGLHMRTSTDGWAVGEALPITNPSGFPPTILHWNGAAWTAITPSGVALGQTLYAVDTLSATEGWAVGDGTIFGDHSTVAAAMLKWDGTIWTSVPSGTPVGARLYSIDMLSSTDGWAVGCEDPPTCASPVIVRWNGLAWSQITAPSVAGLHDVFMLAPTDGWAVGNATAGQATIVHWDGTQWRRVPGPATGGAGFLRSIHMVSSTDGWAVGQVDMVSAPDGAPGPRSLIVHWDGMTWDVVATSPLPPTMSVALQSVFMVAALDGWVVSGQGLILHYGPEFIPATITSTSTITETTTETSTSTSTSTTSTTSTSTSVTTSPPAGPVPGFPIESILAGLLGGLIALTIIRRRRRL